MEVQDEDEVLCSARRGNTIPRDRAQRRSGYRERQRWEKLFADSGLVSYGSVKLSIGVGNVCTVRGREDRCRPFILWERKKVRRAFLCLRLFQESQIDLDTSNPKKIPRPMQLREDPSAVQLRFSSWS